MIATSGMTFAQSASRAADAPSSTTETIELSPFIVSETDETGWIANETLAGTRLRTEYKDLGNQI
ncbi:MAG TPA: hypothetical protein PLV87_16330, partial [Opitutaceae bacterium]|nr:hypothetical protein [Opitutaceae bacterium]